MSSIANHISAFAYKHGFSLGLFFIIFIFCFFSGGLVVVNGQTIEPTDSHVVTLYEQGQATDVPTRAQTVEDFLHRAGVVLHEGDLVEPAVQTVIDGENFRVHVYRARPVLIVDGLKTVRALTPHDSPKLVAEKAGIVVYPEDRLTLSQPTNILLQPVLGEVLTIDRATPVTFSLYGAPAVTIRTHALTVSDVLAEQNIVPEAGATIVPAANTPLTANLAIFVSKFGKKIATIDEQIPFETELIPDPTKPNGVITTIRPGVPGKKQVVYEIDLRDNVEIGRTMIQEVVVEPPVKGQQTIGTKPGNGLSKSKGVNMFIDSQGVTHRETYYDLPMSVVMRNCGAGGQYSVRADGTKVDKDGYVLVAANLNIYPRCSTVETSLGMGKVYDTGGFVLVHPYGFDLATDWSNYDGR